MGKQTSSPTEKRGKFKSGRVWKEQRKPAGSRTRSKALKSSWKAKMNLKASRDQAQRLERDLKQATQEQRRTERERIAAGKKRKEANRLKDELAKTKVQKGIPKRKRNKK